MPVPTRARINVEVIVDIAGRLLVHALGTDPLTYRLPGGPVRSGEPVEDAVHRVLADLRGPAPVRSTFAGCVEHGQPGPGTYGLTVLHAVVLDAGGADEGWTRRIDGVLIKPEAGLPIVPVEVGAVAWRWWTERWPLWHGLPVPEPDPWWTSLRQSVQTVRAQLSARREELRGSTFRDAAVAMCALVAVADGYVDEREREATVRAVTTEEVLSHFSAGDLERLFDLHVARLWGDLAAGKRAALREIARVRGNPAQARAVIRIGAVIGRADGDFDPSERQVVLDAARILGLDLSTLAVQAVDR